jgi:hypothetical protein
VLKNFHTLAILQEARVGEDNLLALKAIARAEKQIDLQARLLVELHENNTTVNVLGMPEWKRLRTFILGALSRYPEAKLPVIQAIEKAGHGNGR